MYLLLPLEDSLSNELRINWPGITACTFAVEFLTADGNRGNPSLNQTDSSVTEHKETNVIHFANRSIDVNNISNIVVLAIHTGRIYSTIELVHDTSAKSSFNDIADLNSSKLATFSEYYNRKYRIVLKHPGQPLLLLKQSHNPHNLLVDFNDEDFSAQALQASSVNEKSWNNIHMPPELLLVLDVPIYVLKAFYLLPSLMHRLESLMLASQLREEIDFHSSNFDIPSSLILEALTTLRCCESFSMERLELLGDSVLKYAVSCHLFLRDPEKHEGELSMIRSLALSNSTLHKLGTDRKLQGYIRDSAFDPRRWVAPGQLRLRSFPCNCRVDSREVPLDKKFQTEDLEIKVSISCDRGHRWMCSKTISDCVEALIGAYYVSGGLIAALHMMKWLGIDAELDPSLEALTHASANEFYCYQRLEFLGDSVLDLLITRYLYCNHTDIDSGELTDLRSASALGELIESIVTAILIDTNLNLDEVWRIVEPLLSPIVTPDKLELPPLQELNELCDSLGYFIREKCVNTGEMVHAKLWLQLDDILLVGEAFNRSKKVAKGKAALYLLKELEDRGISRKRTKQGHAGSSGTTDDGLLEPKMCKKQKIAEIPSPTNDSSRTAYGVEIPSPANDSSRTAYGFSSDALVIARINTNKGQPRATLYETCRKQLWPRPTFETTEERSRSPMEIGKGADRKIGFNSFVTKITLNVPSSGIIECTGDVRADKKSSWDSAAILMLYSLKELGKLIIRESYFRDIKNGVVSSGSHRPLPYNNKIIFFNLDNHIYF
ncbi:Endoribonuclease Dicer -like protein [Gossypium arboreum]|uniref:Endoribonuclease Dicer-like protein n=1 Tax=Gossypium arboreum TaxID=29729 RepID=A0A0B0MZ65_GOSAR|nr:Endoribonuclease Dicer -like protein [Gossypium arboreum]